jgi:uncharacterized protein (DUF4415 family)
MSTKPKKSEAAFVDPDDAPEWTEDQLDRAELAEGGTILRKADGTLTKRGRPRLATPKQIVSLRLEPEVISAFRATGAGWQKRMGEVLRNSLVVRESTGAFAGRVKSLRSDTIPPKGEYRAAGTRGRVSRKPGEAKK